MPEASTSAASKLAAQVTGEDTAPNTTDPIEDEGVGQEEEEELDSTEETPEDQEAEEAPEEGELPDKIKEILSKNRKELREANARANAAEKALAAKEAKPEESTESPKDDKFKALFIQSAAKTALAEAGLTQGTDRLLKLIDLSSVEVDESGTISGLEDQIADLKEDFKDLFAPKQVRKSTGNVDGSRRVAPSVPKTSAELLAGRLS